jgi:hypothetical protein
MHCTPPYSQDAFGTGFVRREAHGFDAAASSAIAPSGSKLWLQGGGSMRLVTVGVGAAASPRYAPAGLLVVHGDVRVMIDGGPGAEPARPIDAWLVTDARSELIAAIRRLARGRRLEPAVQWFQRADLVIRPEPVVHTNHPTFGYRIEIGDRLIVWAPEFFAFPSWAAGADLMFAEASSWSRPIRFARGAGGHLPVLEVAEAARTSGVRRLVFAHIGRPTLAALAGGARPPFGELAHDGQVFRFASPSAPNRAAGRPLQPSWVAVDARRLGKRDTTNERHRQATQQGNSDHSRRRR